MSAFLKYSQQRRKYVKEQNPDMANTDISRLLGEMWRNASPRERAPYVEEEERERAIYKKDIAKFRADQAKEDAASRTSHQSVKRMSEYPMQAQEEAHHPSAEEANAASQRARFFEEYRPEQIAPVASSDSHSLHEFRVPHYDPYAGPQYSSRSQPPGTGKHGSLTAT
jgi:membrane protein involved in colicin uptake